MEPIDDDVSDAVIAVELDDLEADDFETDEPGDDVSDGPESDDPVASGCVALRRRLACPRGHHLAVARWR